MLLVGVFIGAMLVRSELVSAECRREGAVTCQVSIHRLISMDGPVEVRLDEVPGRSVSSQLAGLPSDGRARCDAALTRLVRQMQELGDSELQDDAGMGEPCGDVGVESVGMALGVLVLVVGLSLLLARFRMRVRHDTRTLVLRAGTRRERELHVDQIERVEVESSLGFHRAVLITTSGERVPLTRSFSTPKRHARRIAEGVFVAAESLKRRAQAGDRDV